MANTAGQRFSQSAGGIGLGGGAGTGRVTTMVTTAVSLRALLLPFEEVDLDGLGLLARSLFLDTCRRIPQLAHLASNQLDRLADVHSSGGDGGRYMVNYSSFCQAVSMDMNTQPWGRTAASTGLGLGASQQQQFESGLGAPRASSAGGLWRRLRRWAQEMAEQGVNLRQMMAAQGRDTHPSNAGHLSRFAFRRILTALGAPVSDAEWARRTLLLAAVADPAGRWHSLMYWLWPTPQAIGTL